MSANWLRRYRDKFGLSQEELATQLQLAGFDVSRASISHWEGDKVNPPLDNPSFRNALARVFQTSILDLLMAAGYEINIQQSEQARHAAWIIDHLPESDRDFALGMLEKLLEKAQHGA